jgi:hypothetical protein
MMCRDVLTQSIGEFLESVLRGRGAIPLQTTPLPSLPTETKKCTPKPKAQEQPKKEESKSSGGSGAGSGEAGVNEVLTAANFEKKVLNSKQPWMVEFFAPWYVCSSSQHLLLLCAERSPARCVWGALRCGHCKTLAPEWAKASASMKNMIKFGTHPPTFCLLSTTSRLA